MKYETFINERICECFEKLASLGMNIVLISRTHSKLQELAYEISSQIIYISNALTHFFIRFFISLAFTEREHHTIQIRTIATDFTEGDSIYPLLKFELVNLPSGVGMLINNVGMDATLGRFAELPADEEEDIQKIINCNIMAMARLTNLILPGMRSRQRGIVINVGSIWGTGTSCSTNEFAPCSIIYGATKVTYFTNSFGVPNNPFIITYAYFHSLSGFRGQIFA